MREAMNDYRDCVGESLYLHAGAPYAHEVVHQNSLKVSYMRVASRTWKVPYFRQLGFADEGPSKNPFR